MDILSRVSRPDRVFRRRKRAFPAFARAPICRVLTLGWGAYGVSWSVVYRRTWAPLGPGLAMAQSLIRSVPNHRQCRVRESAAVLGFASAFALRARVDATTRGLLFGFIFSGRMQVCLFIMVLTNRPLAITEPAKIVRAGRCDLANADSRTR